MPKLRWRAECSRSGQCWQCVKTNDRRITRFIRSGSPVTPVSWCQISYPRSDGDRSCILSKRINISSNATAMTPVNLGSTFWSAEQKYLEVLLSAAIWRMWIKRCEGRGLLCLASRLFFQLHCEDSTLVSCELFQLTSAADKIIIIKLTNLYKGWLVVYYTCIEKQ